MSFIKKQNEVLINNNYIQVLHAVHSLLIL